MPKKAIINFYAKKKSEKNEKKNYDENVTLLMSGKWAINRPIYKIDQPLMLELMFVSDIVQKPIRLIYVFALCCTKHIDSWQEHTFGTINSHKNVYKVWLGFKKKTFIKLHTNLCLGQTYALFVSRINEKGFIEEGKKGANKLSTIIKCMKKKLKLISTNE